jgi:hypothetical protein
MNRITGEQLNAIRERAEKATEGQWLTIHNTDICVEEPPGSCDIDSIAYADRVPDAEFIANARQDIPALLAEVEYLNGVIGALRSSLGEIWHYVEGNGNLLVQEAIKYAEEI